MIKTTVWTLALLAAGIFLANLGGECQRPGCGHYKVMHGYRTKGRGGICAFYATDGCDGFIK